MGLVQNFAPRRRNTVLDRSVRTLDESIQLDRSRWMTIGNQLIGAAKRGVADCRLDMQRWTGNERCLAVP
jgi:hypothetical protein